MRHFVSFVAKVVVCIGVVACAAWFGLKFYFTHVDRISSRVQYAVTRQLDMNRSPMLSYQEIPETYKKAVVATEDRRFFTNIGIDFRGVWRAIWVDIRGTQPPQGGSTITQQLIHNTLLNKGPKTFRWKLTEALYAIGLYDTMSKQETLTLYANDIYFGQGAYGLYDAAATYFGKAPSALNDGELTLLAGLPNAPSVYDPFHDMKLARERQHLVIHSMVEDGVISTNEANQISSEPIRLQNGT